MQDTPAVKLTYTAAVTVPVPLTALMSEVPQGSPESSTGEAATHTFKFKQDVPIPSYLLALAVGELEYRQIGPRSKVGSIAQGPYCRMTLLSWVLTSGLLQQKMHGHGVWY